MADSLRRVGAMDAVNGVSQMHRASAQRITRAPCHKAGQIRLARNHFRRRVPIRPLSLAGDLQQASPGEAVAADPDAVTQRARLTLDQVQVTFAGFDNNGASRVLRAIKHRLPLKIFRKTLIRITVIDARSNIFHRRLKKGNSEPCWAGTCVDARQTIAAPIHAVEAILRTLSFDLLMAAFLPETTTNLDPD